MYIQMLGTSCMIPTKDRSHSAMLLFHDKDSILFDCGEGTQRQMMIAGIDINRISKILISHWHGDHVLGLPGLIQTLAAQNYSKHLKIYGPKNSKAYLDSMLKGFSFDSTRLEIDVIELSGKEGTFFNNKDYELSALLLDHSIPTLGFSFREADRRKINLAFAKKIGLPEGPLMGKLQEGHDIIFKGEKISVNDATKLIQGRKFCYIADTTPCNNAIKLAKHADLLVCESTHLSGIEDKTEETKHMNAKQAAMIANQADVKKLVLTHFSPRYKDTSDIEDEAQGIFHNTVAAKDFMTIRM